MIKFDKIVMVKKMSENIVFENLDELFNRVKPALYSKCKELKREGYNLVSEKDIWNYLVEATWKKRNDLQLVDLVSDILFASNYDINEFVAENLKKIKKGIDKKDESIL